MTHHCPRSNWTGPESELRKGICPRCAETTLYEDCSVRPLAITFTDGEGRFHVLRVDDESNATPDDLARAGYTPSAENVEVQRLCLEAAKRTRELEALRAIEHRLRNSRAIIPYPMRDQLIELLAAVEEARK